MEVEYIKVSLEDYNDKTRLIKKQEDEIKYLKMKLECFEKAFNLHF